MLGTISTKEKMAKSKRSADDVDEDAEASGSRTCPHPFRGHTAPQPAIRSVGEILAGG